MNLVGIIPAHLASVRFPRKILYKFKGIPMIEHVRRRALQSKLLSKVIVATCDKEIAEVIEQFGGEVILTSSKHKSGTSRIAEAASNIDCSHVMLIQGDEPLLLSKHIDKIAKNIKKYPDINCWNAIGKLDKKEELDKHSFVKCIINNQGRILFCFRRSPSYATFTNNQKYIFKVLGIIAYRKDVLIKLTHLDQTIIERNEQIEQLKILEYGYNLFSVLVSPTLPSVNEPSEVNLIDSYLQSNDDQKKMLTRIKIL
jgi:3-deoxy-manno-octulosonate cytidylyltransferase (CMP-KDO synthetase)